jgi:cell division protein FtsI (penicillin-binding protein 3)
VVIDEPAGKGVEVTGGTVAAPAWGVIANETLRQLGVMPASAREQVPLAVASLGGEVGDAMALNHQGPKQLSSSERIGQGLDLQGPKLPAGRALVPDLSGLAARSAIRRLAERSLEPDLKGSGRAVAQSPRAGSIVKRGARVRVTLAPP